jgi:Flp pilus assembly protein TadD
MNVRVLTSLCLAALITLVAAPVAAAEPQQLQREIIPGSELMTSQEREQYRLRLRGAGTPQERERLRAEHVRVMEERAQMRGLQLIDYSRLKGTP